ncbi:hypothetical protein C1H46_005396 [Malus baccata]|uniref:Peptidase A1 domain-containing protein n=1 Tax=Malus baccata TaxID=106549 RepID=A0A540NEI5_MALBA|nr:hypothetical protein C1H46_005396 [Malus baccata]
MAAYHSLALVSLSTTTLLFILCASSFSLVSALNGGFSVDLIHRDSPKSPFYNPSLTPAERLRKAFRRSINRINHFNPTASLSQQASPNQAEATIISDNGEYLLELSIGTPPFPIKGVVDTETVLSYVRSVVFIFLMGAIHSLFTIAFAIIFLPFLSLTEDDDHHHGIDFSLELIHRDSPSSPLYNPAESHWQRLRNALQRSHHRVTNHFGRKGTCSNDKFCYYNYTYGDNSYTTGNLSVDTVTLASRTAGKAAVSIPNTIFGCGHDNGGIFGGTETGIVGLGSGAVSLISQIGNVVGRKSLLLLGRATNYNFIQTCTLSKVVKMKSQARCILVLQVSSPQSFKGNMIIDSGTTITTLPTKLYQSFETAIRKAIHLEVTKDPTGILQLCYKTRPEIDAPIVTVHFRGADVKLKSVNTFVRVREDVVCLAFSPTNDVGIYGNVAQMNFLVGFDLQERTLSFKATDCGTG